VLALLSTIAILWLVRNHAESPLPPLEVMPLVAFEGKQASPTFSPDGNRVAFVGDKGEKGAGIYTTLVGNMTHSFFRKRVLGFAEWRVISFVLVP
jgi:roadblock/LC7 domain-containing protein